MKKILKTIMSKIRVSTYQRLLAHSMQNELFYPLKSVPLFDTRESLWNDCIQRFVKSESKITYIEFGVFEGKSISFFSQNNVNPESTFIGLDSFEGLPEDWGDIPKGAFNKDGMMPNIKDKRVKFIKGWFQNTWPELKKQTQDIKEIENLVVHYDADLYSSTLFALTKIHTLQRDYIAIFDEFSGDETRALFDYLQSYNASVEFYSKTYWNGYPFQVACKITHN